MGNFNAIWSLVEKSGGATSWESWKNDLNKLYDSILFRRPSVLEFYVHLD
jgi:hypothetical protein